LSIANFPLILLVFNNPCYITAAFGAGTTKHQHSGLDLAGKVADG
jgi:hypothetical protein